MSSVKVSAVRSGSWRQH